MITRASLPHRRRPWEGAQQMVGNVSQAASHAQRAEADRVQAATGSRRRTGIGVIISDMTSLSDNVLNSED